MKHRAAGSYALLGLFTALACDTPVQPEPGEVRAVFFSILSGDGQTGAVGAELAQPVVVRVTRRSGNGNAPVARFLVNFRAVEGGGTVFAGSALTDANGIAQDYWTLGPNAGANVLEVRSVDPTTADKQVHGRFTATGMVPGPEVCNGVDDDLDGTVDDPSWRYCINGQPAPNTDGMNACSPGYFDLNGVASDGCESLGWFPHAIGSFGKRR
jgi:hypothetical protein